MKFFRRSKKTPQIVLTEEQESSSVLNSHNFIDGRPNPHSRPVSLSGAPPLPRASSHDGSQASDARLPLTRIGDPFSLSFDRVSELDSRFEPEPRRDSLDVQAPSTPPHVSSDDPLSPAKLVPDEDHSFELRPELLAEPSSPASAFTEPSSPQPPSIEAPASSSPSRPDALVNAYDLGLGVDPEIEPELALALMRSIEDENARIAKLKKKALAKSVERKPLPLLNQKPKSAPKDTPPVTQHDYFQQVGNHADNMAGQNDLKVWKSEASFPAAVDVFEKSKYLGSTARNPKDLVKTDRYKYQALEKDYIRILVLKGDIEGDPVLDCDIIHAPLRASEVPEYEALSYCWGNSKIQHEILLGGKVMSIGENLWIALKNLRSTEEGKNRMLWVDALCINQQDTEERSIQVLRMGRIYQRAKRVVIFLGASSHQYSHASWAVSPIREHSDAHMGCAIKAMEAGVAGIQDVASHQFACTTFEDLPEWCSPCFGSSLSFLLSSPWFRRRWVIQELAFSRDAIIQWGPHQVAWENLVDFVAWVEVYKDQFQFGEKVIDSGLLDNSNKTHIDVKTPSFRQEGEEAGITVKALEGLMFASRRMVKWKKHGGQEKVYGLFPLDALVTRFAAFNATDPRDIIYSLLAFSKDRENWIPDYEKNVYEVFVEFVRYAVQKTSRLDIICFPWARMYGKKLPSWIKPRLGHPTRPLFKEHVEAVFEEPLLQIDTLHMYSASGSTVAREVEVKLEDRYILQASGIQVASICARARTMSPDVTPYYTEQFKEWYRTAISWGTAEGRPQSAQSNARKGHSRQHSGSNLLLVGPSAPARPIGKVRNAFYRVVVAGKYTSEHTPQSDKVLFKQGLQESFLGIAACSPLFQRIRPACYDRRLIWTDTGMLGLAPRKAEAKDLICILFGCSVPLILRPKDDKYIIIGECYVDGIMNGEAILNYEMGEHQKMEFEIL